jgi:hypothetical protein
VTFTVIFLPIYFLKIRPRKLAKKNKDDLKSIEAAPNSENTSHLDTKYGAISATPRRTESTKSTAELLAAGNYSPLGPVANGKF